MTSTSSSSTPPPPATNNQSMLEAQRDALEDFVGHIKVISTKKLNCNINTVEDFVRAEKGKAQDGVQRQSHSVLNPAYNIVKYAEHNMGISIRR